MDDKLFSRILLDKHPVLYQLLPPERHCGYSLRPRKHELCLTNKSRLDELSFIWRHLYKDTYWTVLNLILLRITFTIVFTWLPPCAQKFSYRYHTGAGELMCWVRRVCQWRSVQKYTNHQDQRTFLPLIIYLCDRIPTAATYGSMWVLAGLYFTDWKAVLQYVPLWGSKYLHQPPRWPVCVKHSTCIQVTELHLLFSALSEVTIPQQP